MEIKKLNKNDFNDVVYALRINQKHGKDAMYKISLLRLELYEDWYNGDCIIRKIGHNKLVQLISRITCEFDLTIKDEYKNMMLMVMAGKKINDIATHYGINRRTVNRYFNRYKEFLFIELNRRLEQWMQTNYCNMQNN